MRLRLAPGERVIVKTRAHRRVLTRPALGFLAVVALTAFALGWLSRDGLPAPVPEALPLLRAVVPLAAAVLLLAWSVGPLLRWSRTWTVLTNRRVVIRRGAGGRSQWEIPLVLVRAIHVRQTVLQRGAGAGTLLLETANGRATLRDMPGVHRLRELVLDAMEALPRPTVFDGVELDVEPRGDWTGHG
ncbi:MAG: PH domain-containing protein [Arthrobacter sp.]|uniref:PH domain-containing protein n=1 Tax=Arthrobacter sp. TaxID=1667 RepID=UPI00347DF625